MCKSKKAVDFYFILIGGTLIHTCIYINKKSSYHIKLRVRVIMEKLVGILFLVFPDYLNHDVTTT